MAKEDFIRRYLTLDVVAAAKLRIRDAILSYDKVILAFSGGKDSLVVLRLMEEVYAEMGIRRKIPVVFYDEEFLPMDVIDYVNEIRDSGKYDFRYMALRIEGERVIFDKAFTYIKWDTGREWVRPMPEGAITSDDIPFPSTTQNALVSATAHVFNAQNVCIMLGLRGEESLMRLNGIARNTGRCDVYDTGAPYVKRAFHGRPIYDWTETDVFKYLEEHGGYCKFYDKEMFTGQPYRVSCPLHRQYPREHLPMQDPWLYERWLKIFPETAAFLRYSADYGGGGSSSAVIEKYPHSFAGIRQYIEDTYADEPKKKADGMAILDRAESSRQDAKRRNPDDPFGGYPLLYVFEFIIKGIWKHGIRLADMNKLTRAYFEYEGIPYELDRLKQSLKKARQ